jgi:hypothetical protein
MSSVTQERIMPPKNKLSRRALAIKNGYKSGLEDNIADQLKALGKPVNYETRTIKWDDHMLRSYTPDFNLDNGIIIESKGRFTASDRRKHVEIQKQYPELDIRFVFTNSRSYYSAKTTANRKTYGDWCDANGFKYADKLIPQEWIDES